MKHPRYIPRRASSHMRSVCSGADPASGATLTLRLLETVSGRNAKGGLSPCVDGSPLARGILYGSAELVGAAMCSTC
jgi:hypothetical protein